jgi:cytoskeleton protein RodZ
VFEIGTSLREARLRQGLGFPELEHATKIRSKYLRALEDEQFDVLPAQTYVKGFLRTYAEYLGLDGQLYVDEYNSRYVGGEDETPLRTSRIPPTGHERRVAAGVVLAVLGGIAVVAALVIAAWKFGGGSSPSTPVSKSPSANKHRKKHKQNVPPKPVTVAIRATHGYGSYIEARLKSVTGPQLYSGTLEPGHRLVFHRPKLWLKIDAPANVAVRVNGHPRNLPGYGYPRIVTALPTGRLTLASAAG